MTEQDRALVRDLRDVAAGAIRHEYMGACPDAVQGYDTRDPECDACRVLLRADAALAAEEEGSR